MIYSEKLHHAIRFSAEAHKNQLRKVSGLSYIIHPLAVALILSYVTDDEDILIAGILHDTVEDTDLTINEIRTEFGENVARMVNDVTEQDRSLPWAERKQIALDHIKKMQHDSQLVKTADVLQNLSDHIYDHQKLGDQLFNKFGAPKEKQLERYQKIIDELENVWSGNPLLPVLKERLTLAEENWTT